MAMATKIATPKGFRDFLPQTARLRDFVLSKLVSSIEKFGFEPLETSAIEFAETLKGKYGEEEKLIFEFTDRGGREVALRYDQTVPLARIVAANADLPKPFKRYQVQPVWRAENPQKGRFREFVQVDFDTVGTDSLLSDAEIVAAVVLATENIGFKNFVLKINDRDTFRGLSDEVIRIIDKLDKIGEVGVVEQLKRRDYDVPQAKALLKRLRDSAPTQQISSLFEILESLKISPDRYAYEPTLARGLDYYTGLIFELEIEGYAGGSVGGGGRYDDLIGRFANSKIPATGFSFGFDRLIEAATEENLLPKYLPTTQVLVTVFDKQSLPASLALVSKLRIKGIATEISLSTNDKLEKQLKYADNKDIPYAIILGPEEIKKDLVTLKNLSNGKQETVRENELFRKLTRK